MVVKRQCSFCAREIEPGTGMMYVRRDGTVFHFCTSSCRKQQLYLHRVGHRFKWTRAHELKRAADRSTAQKAPAPPPKAPRARVVRAPAEAAPAAAPTPAAEPSPSVAEAAPSEAAPSPAAAKKPRRPRKKAESRTAASE
jgi:large subunit ribosomal protein L24e